MPITNTDVSTDLSCTRCTCGELTLMPPSFCTAMDTTSIGSGNVEVMVAALPSESRRNAI
jgi:hypothetical protein